MLNSAIFPFLLFSVFFPLPPPQPWKFFCLRLYVICWFYKTARYQFGAPFIFVFLLLNFCNLIIDAQASLSNCLFVYFIRIFKFQF